MLSGLAIAWDIVWSFWAWYIHLCTITIGVVVGIIGPFAIFGHLIGRYLEEPHGSDNTHNANRRTP